MKLSQNGTVEPVHAPAHEPAQSSNGLTLAPDTVLGAAIDERAGLVKITSRRRFDIADTEVVFPLALLDSLFHTSLGLRLRAAGVPIP